MSTATKNSILLPMSAAVIALVVGVSGCGDNTKHPPQSTSAQPVSTSSSSSVQPAGRITLEVNGSGDVYAIWSDPFGQLATDHATLPFSKTFPMPADAKYVVLNWTSRDDNPKGCKITVDDKVVVEHAPGTDTQCIFQR
ncbi:MAG: hypothetical protein QOH57_162 [Mycobacterium sp.]|nr:hypothetical protein [Mycobacterium sp.]